MGDIWKQLTKSLGPRWLLFSFMPSFAFWFLTVGGWAIHEHKLRLMMQNPGVFESVVFLVVVILSAWLMTLLSKTTVMLFEGYLLPSGIRRRLLGRKIRKWKNLLNLWEKLLLQLNHKKRDDEDYSDILNQFRMIDSMLVYNYPSRKENIMPTDLGNILKASEEYPRLRYGLDPVVLWEHLYLQLPSDLRDALDVSFNEMVLMLRSSILSAVLGIEWFIFTIFKGIYPLNYLKLGMALLFLFVFSTFALDFYRVSLAAALKFSKLIRTAFDLYRARLAKAFGYELPEELEKEREFWNNLTLFIYRGIPTKPGLK